MTIPWTVLTAAALLTACAAPTGPAMTTHAVSAPHAMAIACTVDAGRADTRCTPGVTNPAVTQGTIRDTICRKGWTKNVRPPTAYTNLLKTSQMQQYGETGPPSSYEEDHLIPLEAGGNPTDPGNLFPQPGTAAKAKDRDENQARNDICSGRKSLAETQRWITARWTH